MLIFVGRPVVEASGWTGAYDFQLDLHEVANASGWSGAVGGDGGAEQLGLRMDARKAPVEVLVVDHAERRPSGN